MGKESILDVGCFSKNSVLVSLLGGAGINTSIILCISLLFFSATTNAAILYDNGDPETLGGYNINVSETIDNFTLFSSSDIYSVGFYFETNGYLDPSPKITYNIYTDNNGLGELITTGSGVNLNIVDSGFPAYPGIAYLATFDFASTLSLESGEYWLGLTDLGGAYWTLTSNTGTHYYNDNGLNLNEFSGDNAFYLEGLAAVPVPGAVWLFGSGLIGLIGLARRKA